MDGQTPAPPKTPSKDDSPVNTKKHWFPAVSKWHEMDFVHPQCFFIFPRGRKTTWKFTAFLPFSQGSKSQMPGTAQYNGKTFVGVRFQEPSWIYGFRISCARPVSSQKCFSLVPTRLPFFVCCCVEMFLPPEESRS